MDRDSTGKAIARVHAAHAKALMTRPGLSLPEAARLADTTPRDVLEHFGRWIRRDPRTGRLVALPDDEVFRMQIISTKGVVEADVRGSSERSRIYWHGRAIDRALDPAVGDIDGLHEFDGVKISGHTLETDPETLEELWLEGEIDFVVVYADAE
jgi:hypothetical protein